MFITVRLKNHPERFVGKKNPSYAFSSDQELQRYTLDPSAHWFVPEGRAKVWTDFAPLRWMKKYNREGKHTFSEYEVLIHEEETRIIPLDSI